MPNATLVTAFFTLGDEHAHSSSNYKTWAAAFLGQIRSPMVVNADAAALAWLRPLRGSLRAQWITQRVADLECVRRYSVNSRPKGRAKHGVNYNLIMHEKVVLLFRASVANTFGTSHFLWVDAGMWRVPHPFANWPCPDRLAAIPAGRLIALNVHPFPAGVLSREWSMREVAARDPRGESAGWGVIGGGVFGGRRGAIERLAADYFATLDAMVKAPAGAPRPAASSDQDIFRRMYLVAPEGFALVPAPAAQWCQPAHHAIKTARSGGHCFSPAALRGCASSKAGLQPPCAGTASAWMYMIAWLAADSERPPGKHPGTPHDGCEAGALREPIVYESARARARLVRGGGGGGADPVYERLGLRWCVRPRG